MFNPCTEAKQIKYQQIQEDVGGVSVLFGLRKFLKFIGKKKRTLQFSKSYGRVMTF